MSCNWLRASVQTLVSHCSGCQHFRTQKGCDHHTGKHLSTSWWHILRMPIVLCFWFASSLALKITSQFPAPLKKNAFPQVMIALSHLSPIDLRPAGALQGVCKLVNEAARISWGFRSLGMSGCDLLLQPTATILRERRDLPLLTKFPLEAPIYYSVRPKKNI